MRGGIRGEVQGEESKESSGQWGDGGVGEE